MRIRVTPDHVERGQRCFSWAYAVALAIAEAIPCSDPWVSPFEITISRHGRTLTFETPEVVAAFIDAFDRGRAVEPIEFELPVELAASRESPAGPRLAATAA